MKHPRLDRLPNKRHLISVVAAAFALGLVGLLSTTVPGWAATGWSGSAGMKSGCVGWNCDGKNPCTGMGCGSEGPSKDTKAGSTKSTGTGAAKSGATKNSKDSSNSTKGSSKNTKVGPSLPDVESLTGKSKKPDGWGGDRNSDTRTNDQRYQPEAKQTVENLQKLTGGGKPAPEGWGGGLKSDSRTIEQKLDTP